MKMQMFYWELIAKQLRLLMIIKDVLMTNYNKLIVLNCFAVLKEHSMFVQTLH